MTREEAPVPERVVNLGAWRVRQQWLPLLTHADGTLFGRGEHKGATHAWTTVEFLGPATED